MPFASNLYKHKLDQKAFVNNSKSNQLIEQMQEQEIISAELVMETSGSKQAEDLDTLKRTLCSVSSELERYFD